MRRKHSPKTIEKMRAAAKRRIKEKPWTTPPHVGQKPFLGRTHTEEARARISEAMQGNTNAPAGEGHHAWLGDRVGYFALHDWISRHYGRPSECENCGVTDPEKRYEWANISGEYHRDRNDFRRLCKKCHNDMDGVNAWQQRRA